MIMDWDTAARYLPRLLDGAVTTVALTAVTLVLGLIVAVPVALCRNARAGGARAFATSFVFVFRGTPLLALLYVVYYGAPELPAIRDGWAWRLVSEPWPCALIALSLNSAGYLTEIIAGAMRAVPRGEVEAALAAGFSRFGLLRRVLVPHAARLSLRAYGNEVVFVIKATSVASLVTIIDILGAANQIYFNTFDPITPFAAAGALYLVLVLLVLRAIRSAERMLSPELRVAASVAASQPDLIGASR